MKHRTYAMILALVLAVSLLASCGPKAPDNSASSTPDASQSQPDGSQPDESLPDASQPQKELTLNAEEITLISNTGETFQLDFLVDGALPLEFPDFTSSDPSVATVDATGLITAVGPGAATITAELDGLTAQCVVTCEEISSQPIQPAPEPEPEKPSGGSSSSAPTPSSVNLSDFYTTITSKYDFAFMMEANADMLTNYFTGLSDISTAQQVVYLCGMSPSPHGDFALVQVSDSKDVDAVKAIFQARIDYMVGDGNGPGGALYPMEQTTWMENARIVSNGDYVMLIAHENCDDIVSEFNALF